MHIPLQCIRKLSDRALHSRRWNYLWLQAAFSSGHVPNICFTEEATALQRAVELPSLLKPVERSLQDLIRIAKHQERAQGSWENAPIYGIWTFGNLGRTRDHGVTVVVTTA